MTTEHYERHGDHDCMQQIAIDVAVMKEQVATMNEKLDKHVDTASTAFKDIYSKLSKYDIIFGKIGLVSVAVVFVVTLILTNAAAYFRALFTHT